MRARKKKWALNELAANRRLVSEPENLAGRWNEYFENENPIHLELGCGKGRFIVGMASAEPNVNFIALEREKNVIVSGMRASDEVLKQNNLAFIMSDVDNVTSFFSEGEISRIYINFCDPWPGRKKWRKRRLTHVNYLDMYKKIFGPEAGESVPGESVSGESPSGEIFFKTDNRELFEFSLCQFTEGGFKLRNVSLDLHDSDFEGNIMTEYEKRFHLEGMPIYRCEAVR